MFQSKLIWSTALYLTSMKSNGRLVHYSNFKKCRLSNFIYRRLNDVDMSVDDHDHYPKNVKIIAPVMINPAPSQTRRVTFSSLRPIRMGESNNTTGMLNPLRLITNAIGAKSIAIQRDKVPKPRKIPAMTSRIRPSRSYEKDA